jgi:hypothetical protein
MRITNPNWHPRSLAMLTTKQTTNLKALARGPLVIDDVQGYRTHESITSLIRHGFAVSEDGKYKITDLGRKLLSGSGVWNGHDG